VAQYARGRLLDLGCGKVPLYGLYREKVQEITCVDWTSSLHGTKHLDVACDLNQPIPLPAESFDTILLSDVLEHLHEPEHACREVARLLAPGGHLLMNVPFFYGIHEAPFDYYRYTEFGLRRLIERAGLELISVDALGGIADIFADLSAKTMSRLPAFGRPAAWVMQHAAHTLGRTQLGAKLRERSGQRTPLGYFLVARRRAA
jgi:SAM-dependent methyltransferase